KIDQASWVRRRVLFPELATAAGDLDSINALNQASIQRADKQGLPVGGPAQHYFVWLHSFDRARCSAFDGIECRLLIGGAGDEEPAVRREDSPPEDSFRRDRPGLSSVKVLDPAAPGMSWFASDKEDPPTIRKETGLAVVVDRIFRQRP